MRRRCRITALVAALVLGVLDAAAAAPRVVVSVKPLHSLVAGVMAGVGEPDLILRGAGSPHTYTLRPSEARLLAGAQVIFWIGESFETFMGKPLAVLGGKARIVALERVPGIAMLRGREGGSWEGHRGDEAGHGRHADRAGHGAAAHDGHLWLDPANARIVARVAADVLGEADPENRGRYARNASAVVDRIDALDRELSSTLAPVRGVPFIVFHDAFQYLEERYALRAVGSVTVSPERKPGAKRVSEIRVLVRELGARCIFSEPQFPSALLATLSEGTGVRTGTLDPLGAELPAGPDAYFALMRALGASLAECLQRR